MAPLLPGSFQRCMPGGAEPTANGVHFRVWAPEARRVSVAVGAPPERRFELQPEDDGYFAGLVADIQGGALYSYFLDDRGPYPDPYSRFQPCGPHGPSMVVDHDSYPWGSTEWLGLDAARLVIYEMHVGAFTSEGTFDAAARELPELAELGITCVEIMPVAEFPGRFNWGYDAVDLFAPYHGYGDPEALKRFVDAAHAAGIGVLLDVVYNHLGPDGNYLPFFSSSYFTDRYANEWGEAFNFDGKSSRAVRELVVENAKYWIREFQLDGLRLDATQSVCDATRPHILAVLARAVREQASPRRIILIAENEPQNATLLDSMSEGGYGLDAMWNDDFHHSARVALTGSHDGYFHDYRGRARELVSLIRHGFLFQGQHYGWQHKPRGTPALDRSNTSFVAYIQNHDQVANTLCGIRLQYLTSPGRHRAMTAVLLLAPHIPLLFMGQEFCSTSAFPFFADSAAELAAGTWEGRRKFLRQFTQYATAAAQARIPDPSDPETFEKAKLNFWERKAHRPIYELHAELLRLRHHDPVIAARQGQELDAAVLGESAFLLRWRGSSCGERLLVVNLAAQLDLDPAPEPLLAPVQHHDWQMIFSTDEIRYGGLGAVCPTQARRWHLPAESAILLRETAV
jgi:maltooligosyltrehalose trehalohydrolase